VGAGAARGQAPQRQPPAAAQSSPATAQPTAAAAARVPDVGARADALPRFTRVPPHEPRRATAQDGDRGAAATQPPAGADTTDAAVASFRPMTTRPVTGPYAAFLQASALLGIDEPAAVPPPPQPQQQ